jgi:mRNA-degrading endonuclease RelE of RelBE toxin-antitoxin system
MNWSKALHGHLFENTDLKNPSIKLTKKTISLVISILLVFTPFADAFAQSANASSVRIDPRNLDISDTLPQAEKSYSNEDVAIPSSSSTLAEWFDFFNNPRVADVLLNLKFNISNSAGLFTVCASDFAFEKEIPFNIAGSEITIDKHSINPEDYVLADEILSALQNLELNDIMLFKRCYSIYSSFRYAKEQLVKTRLTYTDLIANILLLLQDTESIYSKVRAGNTSLDIRQAITNLMLEYRNDIGKRITDATKVLYIESWLNAKRASGQPLMLTNGRTIFDYESNFFAHLPELKQQALEGKITPGYRLTLDDFCNHLDFISFSEMFVSDMIFRLIPGGNTYLGMYSEQGKTMVFGIWLDPIFDIALLSGIGAIAARGTALAAIANTTALLTDGLASAGFGAYLYKEMGDTKEGKAFAVLFATMGLLSFIGGVGRIRLSVREIPVENPRILSHEIPGVSRYRVESPSHLRPTETKTPVIELQTGQKPKGLGDPILETGGRGKLSSDVPNPALKEKEPVGADHASNAKGGGLADIRGDISEETIQTGLTPEENVAHALKLKEQRIAEDEARRLAKAKKKAERKALQEAQGLAKARKAEARARENEAARQRREAEIAAAQAERDKATKAELENTKKQLAKERAAREARKATEATRAEVAEPETPVAETVEEKPVEAVQAEPVRLREVEFSSKAKSSLKKLPSRIREKFNKWLEKIQNPKNQHCRGKVMAKISKNLNLSHPFWRYELTNDYRVAYQVLDDGSIHVVDVGPRDNFYSRVRLGGGLI